MSSFNSRRVQFFPSSITKLVSRRPFLFFGLPLITVIVAGSFALSELTQTKVDYNKQKVQQVSEDEDTKYIKKRKFSLQEEYWKLQTGIDIDNWDMVPAPKIPDPYAEIDRLQQENNRTAPTPSS